MTADSPLFLGIDLAWKPVNRTGLAVVDGAGRLLASGTVISDDDIGGWIDRQDGALMVAAVDAPLVVLGQRILYKKGPTRGAGFTDLLAHYETIPELGLAEHPRWLELREVVDAPGPGDLTRIEDEIDAILCAHLAWLWHYRPEALHVYGSLETGYIVAPPPPSHPAANTAAGMREAGI